MRSTLVIDDDVMRVAKEVARSTRTTIGKVISDAFRRDYTATQTQTVPHKDASSEALARMGIFPLPDNGNIVTNDDVNRLREELDI